MRRLKLGPLGLAVGVLLAMAVPGFADVCNSVAGNLVTNCGFESGDFTGWDQNSLEDTQVSSGPFYVYGGANSGNFYATLGNVESIGTISQTLVTTPGQLYTINFYLAAVGDDYSYFEADFNGDVLYSEIDPDTGGAFTLLSFTDTATSASTLLQFQEQDDPAYIALDDISVTPTGSAVPEPASILLLVTGVGFCAILFKRRSPTI